MAVLSVRVDDHIRDLLEERATHEGLTLSEYIRDLLLKNVVPIRETDSSHSCEAAPENMRLVDRQMFALLHRILGHVLPKDAKPGDHDLASELEHATLLEEGFTSEYWREEGRFRMELSTRDCRRVSDILQMFKFITLGIRRLAENGQPVSEELAHKLEFVGFDHDDSLENHMASYVKYLMGDGRSSELQAQVAKNDHGNSHTPMLKTYSRMLGEYQRIMDGRERRFGLAGQLSQLVSHEELEMIASAAVQPSHRRIEE